MLIQAFVTMLASTQLSTTPGYLGLRVAEDRGRLAIAEVEVDSPALRIVEVGDVVVELAGIPVSTERGFAAVMARTQPAERISITVDSNGTTRSHQVVLALPSSAASAPKDCSEPTVTYSIEQDAAESARSHLVLSAQGPGAGDYGISIGGAYADKRPFIDFRYLQGLADVVSLDIELQTYGLQNHLDLGLRFHLISGDGFSLALRGRVHEEHFLEGDDLLLASFSPGILLSFGNERMQFTVGTDTHLYFFAWVEGFEGRFDLVAYGFRPFIGFEYAVTDSMNLFVEAQVRTFQIDGFDTIVEPGFSAGFAW